MVNLNFGSIGHHQSCMIYLFVSVLSTSHEVYIIIDCNVGRRYEPFPGADARAVRAGVSDSGRRTLSAVDSVVVSLMVSVVVSAVVSVVVITLTTCSVRS